MTKEVWRRCRRGEAFKGLNGQLIYLKHYDRRYKELVELVFEVPQMIKIGRGAQTSNVTISGNMYALNYSDDSHYASWTINRNTGGVPIDSGSRFRVITIRDLPLYIGFKKVWPVMVEALKRGDLKRGGAI